MGRYEHLQRISCFLVIVLIIASAIPAEATGLFGSFDELYGVPMPSLNSLIGRNADSEELTDEGKWVTWNSIDDSVYLSFSRYLAANGYSAGEWSMDGDVLSGTVASSSMTLPWKYNAAEYTLSLLYPSNSREEDEPGVPGGKEGDGALPPLSQVFVARIPDLTSATGKMPVTNKSSDTGETIQHYTDVTAQDYEAFSKVLASAGCIADSFSVAGSALTVQVSKQHGRLSLLYDYTNETLDLTYNTLTQVNSTYPHEMQDRGILPILSDLWAAYLPSLSNLIGRAADEAKSEKDLITETWHGFTDADYYLMGDYLEKSGSEVLDYSATETVLTINLRKNNQDYTIIYDREKGYVSEVRHKLAGLERGNRVTATPMPTVRPTPKPTATPRPEYGETSCYNVAVDYLKNMLKNPESLQIHSYSTTYTGDGYRFAIDYSAMNSFGGYTRETRYINVNKYTCNVTGWY